MFEDNTRSIFHIFYEGAFGVAGLIYAWYGILNLHLPVPIYDREVGAGKLIELYGFDLMLGVVGLFFYGGGLLYKAIQDYQGRNYSKPVVVASTLLGLAVLILVATQEKYVGN